MENESHVTFTTRRETCPLNNVQISQAEDVKYLGLQLDRRLTWQLSIQHSTQLASKQPSSKPHGTTREKPIANKLAHRTPNEIPCVTVVFLTLVSKG
jgi:hypothetical protein